MLVIGLIAFAEIGRLQEELPFFVAVALSILFFGSSCVMLGRMLSAKDKLSNDQIIYKPGKKAEHVISTLVDNEPFDHEQRNQYFSEVIDQALIRLHKDGGL